MVYAISYDIMLSIQALGRRKWGIFRVIVFKVTILHDEALLFWGRLPMGRGKSLPWFALLV